MSTLGSVVLNNLVELLPQTNQKSAPCSEDERHTRYIRHQFETSERYFALYPDFDVRGKTVLEIGCGTGGRAAHLATQGAKLVVGIDINEEEIAIARRLNADLYPATRNVLQFLVCGEKQRLDIGCFDVVLLIDAMEHVVSPPTMMKIAHDYTAPGGRFYFSSIGYYHRDGSHTGLLPFVNVFFSDETILDVVRRRVSDPSYVPGAFDSKPPIERWRCIYNLRDRPGEHLNKITIAEMKKLVRYSPFRRSRMTVVGFQHKHPLFRWTDFLTRVPLAQEVYHSMIVVDCVK